MNSWRKLRSLSPRERALLWRVLITVTLVSIGLRLLGWQRLMGILEARIGSTARHRLPDLPPDHVRQHVRQHVQQMARLTAIAAGRRPLHATCLQRSVALWWLLTRDGFDCRVVIGVRRQNGQLQAHAWVEYEGEVINDRPGIREEFAVLGEVPCASGTRSNWPPV